MCALGINNIFSSFKLHPWKWIIVVCCLLAAVLAVQAHVTTNYNDGMHLTSYNNFVIFRQSFFHLLNHQDLYLKYKYEYWDIYKYSPTFAVFMAPFAILPAIPSLLLWNLTNVLALLFGIQYQRHFDQVKKSLVVAFVFIELATSLQNEQCNALVVGLLLIAFGLAEKQKLFAAVGIILFTGFIKLIGIAALSIFILYPKWHKAILYCIIWLFIYLLLPLLFVAPSELLFQYTRWLEILNEDLAGTGGLSVISISRFFSGYEVSKTAIQLTGMVLLLLPLIQWKKFVSAELRMKYFSSVLIWMVIFNHKAESPSFIIAVTGVAIWYFNSSKTIVNHLLLAFCLIGTQLSTTDIFPNTLQNGIFTASALKAIPCFFIWIKLTFELYQETIFSIRHNKLVQSN